MTLALLHDSATVVTKGRFNPGIFSPSWLFSEGIVGEGEYKNANLELITPDFAKFTCGWLGCTVTNDVLELSTTAVEEFERLRDAVIAITRTLPHCPVSAMGVNRNAHFAVDGFDAWHRVGDALTPKEIWKDILDLPGMKSVTVWGVRPDNYEGRIHITVEPSSMIKFGIFVAHNDHFDLNLVDEQPHERSDFLLRDLAPQEATVEKRGLMMSILEKEWNNSMARADKSMRRVSSLSRGEV
jgi:hypothetical protein